MYQNIVNDAIISLILLLNCPVSKFGQEINIFTAAKAGIEIITPAIHVKIHVKEKQTYDFSRYELI